MTISIRCEFCKTSFFSSLPKDPNWECPQCQLPPLHKWNKCLCGIIYIGQSDQCPHCHLAERVFPLIEKDENLTKAIRELNKNPQDI